VNNCNIDSHGLLKDFDKCLLCECYFCLEKMSGLIDELSGMKISPHVDYSSKGLFTLHDELIKARAYSERASFIYSELIAGHSIIKSVVPSILGFCQDEYDKIVVSEVKKYLQLSWEERASFVRVQCINITKLRRMAEVLIESSKSFLDSGDNLARSLHRARNDLDAVATNMKFSMQLGELGV